MISEPFSLSGRIPLPRKTASNAHWEPSTGRPPFLQRALSPPAPSSGWRSGPQPQTIHEESRGPERLRALAWCAQLVAGSARMETLVTASWPCSSTCCQCIINLVPPWKTSSVCVYLLTAEMGNNKIKPNKSPRHQTSSPSERMLCRWKDRRGARLLGLRTPSLRLITGLSPGWERSGLTNAFSGQGRQAACLG